MPAVPTENPSSELEAVEDQDRYGNLSQTTPADRLDLYLVRPVGIQSRQENTTRRPGNAAADRGDAVQRLAAI
jgi:HAMP domain-containing protein